MKFTGAFVVLASLLLPAFAGSDEYVVTYDKTYDNPKYPLSGTACSDGKYGLQEKYPYLGKIPNFPYVGGIPHLTWNSPLCGTCWKLVYTDYKGKSNYIYITAVDAAYSFNLSFEAMDATASGAILIAGTENEDRTPQLTDICWTFV